MEKITSNKLEIIEKEKTENNYLNVDIFQANIAKNKQISENAKSISTKIVTEKDLSENNKEQYEEVELIVEEIIEIEETDEPIEICDEIETLEIEHSEHHVDWSIQSGLASESNKIFKFQNENSFEETKSENCQLFKKQTQQLKTYGNRKKLISQSPKNEMKRFESQKTQSVHNLNSPISSTNSICFENDHVSPEITLSNDLINTSCNLDSNIYDDNSRKELNESKSKIKIIKNQILNEAIDIKSLLKLKKTDKKHVKPVENRYSNKAVCVEEKIASNIKNSEKLRIYAKPSEKTIVLEKPKIMEKVLWKNVSIGNEKKLIPISTAVKIVKIPKNAKVVKIERSKETGRNISLTNIPMKNSSSSTFVKSPNLTKISNVEIKSNNSDKNITDLEFDNMVNKPNNKNLKVYNSPTKSFMKSNEKNSSPELLDKFSLNKIYQKSKGIYNINISYQ